MESYTHETFLSPFTWRYGSEPMRHIWSQTHKRKLWRKLWVALAAAQESIGLVTAAQVADLRAHQDDIDIARSHEFEAELHHDLMAEVHTYAEQCSVGGGIIHLGATSMDIEDNAEALSLRDALDLLIQKMEALLTQFAARIEATADQVCMAFTHLQPAEPTTVGYRLAFTAQDLLEDYQALKRVRASIRGKGFKGAVGTSASYTELLHGKGLTPRQLEEKILSSLGLNAYEVTHQTYPRRQDFEILSVLASFGATAYKFAFDLRLLQSPVIGEWHEPFGSRQIGSSAMPFKRNPIHSENIDSMARYLAGLPRVAWDNTAHHLLERTLDDSGNRRIVLPEAFLTADEIVMRLTRLISGLRIDENSIARTLNTYGVFAATERLLMEAARRGGNRQELHEVIRQQSLNAWEALRQNQPNPLIGLLQADPHFTALIPSEEIPALLTAEAHIGDAPERARNLAASIRQALS